MMPNTLPKKQGEESIHHFSHKHELFFIRGYKWECVACGYGISADEDHLFCERCEDNGMDNRFHMHKSCAELPRKLKHPFHQQHSLTLLDEPPPSKGKIQSIYMWVSDCYCSACGKLCHRCFVYECSECKFYIHSKCAMLFPTTRLPAKHQKLRHPHPLIVCERKIVERNIVDFRCGGCYQSFDNDGEIDYSTLIYVCLECHVLLHESCADLPQNITQHPLHPYCTLTFRISSAYDEIPNRYVICDFCREESRLYYQCSDCSIKMDIPCALLTPCTTTNYKPVGEQKDNGHPHPLIHCNINVNHYGFRNCDKCEQPLEMSAYYCTSCKLRLHESCAHLPHQIQHPFHPHHPLTLSDSTDRFRGKEFSCNSCRDEGKGFVYLCHPCKFYLDLKCISPPLYPMIYMPQLHQHPFALSDIKLQLYSSCDLCGFTVFTTTSIGCLQCDFKIHTHCFPLLPATVKVLWHRHPLTLTRRDSPLIFDGETLYCDVCEDTRYPDDPSYNCAECDLASHVHCVISEVTNYWQEKSTSVKKLLGDTKILGFDDVNDKDVIISLLSGVNKEIKRVKYELEEHEKECAELSAKLEEKKEKCKELEGKLDLLITRSTRLQFKQ